MCKLEMERVFLILLCFRLHFGRTQTGATVETGEWNGPHWEQAGEVRVGVGGGKAHRSFEQPSLLVSQTKQ